MIKTLKWIYNRGREYESIRIKKVLSEFEQDTKNDFALWHDQPSSINKVAKLNFDAEVRKAAFEIVRHMITPTTETAIVTNPAPLDGEDFNKFRFGDKI